LATAERTPFVSTNQQRRDAERRRLQRQLEERRAREAARKRFTLIASIVTTLVVIAAVVVVVVVASGGDGKKKPGVQAGGRSSSAAASSTSPSASVSSSAPAAPPAPTAPCTSAGKKATAKFHGISVGEAKNLKHEPKVSGNGVGTVSNLVCSDLVVGTGKAASASSTVTVQYTGVLFKNGKLFDSSWSRGQAAQFSLAQVVPGFTQGIGGAGAVAPMKVGGRRIMILPPALGYGAQANGSIPANSTLVFVVDLKSIDG
jgi:FKBP-type peptidyl-prolyl cis-trans isomerase